jgi:hypothetical protein
MRPSGWNPAQKLGVDAGEGFYTYPNPAYLAPGFLT